MTFLCPPDARKNGGSHLFAGCGDLGYEDAIVVAKSFVTLCKGNTDFIDRYLEWVVRPEEER